MYFVYVKQSLKDGRFYTGQTEDLERRLQEHNSGVGLVRYTKGKGPWKLIYHEEVVSRAEAMAREKYFKTGAGRDFVKKMIIHYSEGPCPPRRTSPGAGAKYSE